MDEARIGARGTMGRHLPVRRAAAAVAIVAVVAAAAWSVFAPYATTEPDDYSYRAQVAALRDGHLTLSQSQYEALRTKLRATDDRMDAGSGDAGRAGGAPGFGGSGIAQWVEQPDGRLISEKNPGYAFVALAFDSVGAMRWINVAFLLAGAGSVWLAMRRWTGAWGAALAVVLLAWSPFALVFSTRTWMPTYAGAMLVAAGLALTAWTWLATERSLRTRTVALAGAVSALSLATWMRYTDVLVLGVLGFVALVAARRGIGVGVRRTLACGVIGVVAIAGIAWFNAAHYGSATSTGYALTQADRVVGGTGGQMAGGPTAGGPMSGGSSSNGSGTTRSKSGGAARTDVTFSADAITSNLGSMPRRLVYAMPQALVAALAAALVLVTGWWRRAGSDRDPWIVVLLVLGWALPWLLYLAYDWTARQGGAGMSGWVHTTRFYASALGPIAMLAAWAILRLPARAWAIWVGGISAIACVAASVAVAGDGSAVNARPGGMGGSPGMRGGPPPGGFGGPPPGAPGMPGGSTTTG